MAVSYANELYELRRWVDNVNQGFASNQPMIAAPNTPPSVKRLIGIVSNGIKDEYPHYASTLARVADILLSKPDTELLPLIQLRLVKCSL